MKWGFGPISSFYHALHKYIRAYERKEVNLIIFKMLSDTQKEKITYIEDISKAKLFLHDKPITVDEFDDLYDMDNYELHLILETINAQIILARHHSINV